MSEYTARDWQNGKPCPQHGMPYCTPCFKALVALNEKAPDHPGLDALRENIMRRIMGMNEDVQAMSTPGFHRPRRRNFFEDSRQTKFAASCQLGTENFLVIPVDFAIVGDDKTAYKADEAEMRAILIREHLWDTSTPEWMQQDTTLQLDMEDAGLLREFQLFKS